MKKLTALTLILFLLLTSISVFAESNDYEQVIFEKEKNFKESLCG